MQFNSELLIEIYLVYREAYGIDEFDLHSGKLIFFISVHNVLERIMNNYYIKLQYEICIFFCFIIINNFDTLSYAYTVSSIATKSVY